MDSPDKTSLLQHTETLWQAWIELARGHSLPVPEDAAFLETLKGVWEASEFVSGSCMRDPQLLPALLESGDLMARYDSGALKEKLIRATVESANDEQLARAVRRVRRYEMVRIAWRDLAGWAELEETLEDLSALADVSLVVVLEKLYAWACEEFGVPRGPGGEPQRLVVLGMGKLGARELNFSSDIDLIFAFPKHGETDGARHQSNEQFFTRLCQRLIQVIGAQTEEGFVFRVDARLRPFGNSGPLVMSFDAMEDYYQSQAREWERYAMVKARVVAGDFEAGRELMDVLRPFVYRRYLDFGAIESLREMKEMIVQEVQRKGLSDNVKLGSGGIREVEFIGQVFQLIRGGREPDLQERGILKVLALLGKKGYLPEYAVAQLDKAYRFLRLVENRLQAFQDRQVHVLPHDHEGRLRLARSMGYEDWVYFSAVLKRYRERVQAQFERVFAAPQAERHEDEGVLGMLWRSRPDEAAARDLLDAAGFEDPEVAFDRLRSFRDSRACRLLSSRGRDRLDRLMPLVLNAVAEVDNPDATLVRLLQLLEAVARRTAYLALLVESPTGLSQLVRLSSVSPWIAEQLSRYPLLLDELLDPRRLYAPLHRQDLERELETLVASVDAEDLEQQMERLRQFAQSNILRVASADITGAIPLMVVSDYLTEIAEVVLSHVLDNAIRHLVSRHGWPRERADSGDPAGFAIVAYGKLGGIELGYGSDLDLVFLQGSEGDDLATMGSNPVSNGVFFARLGRRLIHMLTIHTPSGVLYDVDMRLRPNGASGLLVSSLQAFEEYQRDDAWTWEHQALVRARVVAGDPEVARRFADIRRRTLARPRDPETLRREVRDMRERMRSELVKGDAAEFDLKQGQGGIADIEFMVQYLVLRWAGQCGDLLEFSDNIRLLDALSRCGLMARQRAEALSDAYRTLRAALHRNVLQGKPARVSAERFPAERELVHALWRELMEEQTAGGASGEGNRGENNGDYGGS